VPAAALPESDALAQQKQKVSYSVPAENAKYTQQHPIEVGDESGHQVRAYEIYRTFPSNAPRSTGCGSRSSDSRPSDTIDSNGASTNYGIFVLENGDKFFAKFITLGQTTAEGRRTSITVGHITGGTGKFFGMQGMVRATGTSDAKAGVNETQTDIEYWFAK